MADQTPLQPPSQPQPDVPQPPQAAPAAPQPTPSGFSTALGAFFRGLLRLIVVLLLGGLLGLGLYFGIPYFYQQLVLPVQQNTQSISQITAGQTQIASTWNEQITGLQNRLTALESQQDTSKEQYSELAAQIAEVKTSLSVISSASDTTNQQLADIEQQVNSLETKMQNMERFASAQATAQGTQRLQLATLEARPTLNSDAIYGLERDIELLKAMQSLTRARLFLTRNDADSARTEIVLAQEILTRLASNAKPEEAQALQAIATRLGLTIQNLATTPLLAIEDIEIAYQLMLNSTTGGTSSGEGLSSLATAEATSLSATGEATSIATTGVLVSGTPSPTPLATNSSGTPPASSPTPTLTPTP